MAVGELNLVPYLDIIVNLNMFMLLTFQVVLELKVINFNPPASGPSTDIAGKNVDDPTVVLSVLITKSGHAITTTEAIGTKQVPLKGVDYDYAELEKQLEALRDRTDIKIDPDNLIVVAEPAVTYDKVVATLDAARYRQDGKTELFPHVTLGMAVGTQ
jgi:biopolymer transport protein TolR